MNLNHSEEGLPEEDRSEEDRSGEEEHSPKDTTIETHRTLTLQLAMCVGKGDIVQATVFTTKKSASPVEK